MKRLQKILGLAALAWLALVSSAAMAQSYPARPIRLVVPWPTGGAADAVARALAEGMRKDLGQTVVVDNKPGATGRIGVDAVRTAPADGYTLILAISNTHGVAAALDPKLPYDPVRDFSAIGVAAVAPLALTIHPSVPVKTLPELVDYAKRNPGKLNFASAGSGSASHLMGQMFKVVAGIDIAHVPYKGAGQAAQDLAAGHVQMIFDGTGIKSYVESGQLRALATTGARRWSAMPNVPTTTEAGYPALQTVAWYGIMGPKNLPEAVVQRLHGSLQSALKDPVVLSTLKNQGMDLSSANSPEAMKTFIAREIERWKGNLKLIHYTPGD